MTGITREGLLALAERCEKASGPDRDLDMDVEESCVGPVRDGYWAERRSRFVSGEYPLDAAPTYTASMDAAMTLVPAEWPSRQCGTTDDGCGWAAVAKHDGAMIGGDTDEGYAECNTAATPALALTAAALRARAATMGGTDDE